MITHFPEWVTVNEYAVKHKLTVRTVHDRVRRREISYEKINGIKLFFDADEWNKVKDIQRPDLLTGKLVWVPKFARAHNYSPVTLLQQIIIGNINAFAIANMVLVNPADETVIAYLKKHPPAKRK